MTINSWIKSATKQLDNIGINSAHLDAVLIAEHSLKIDRAKLITENLKLSDFNNTEIKLLNHSLNRRLEYEPIAYIREYINFYGLNFKVDHRVLIPRPETETMVDYVINHASINSRLLDIGTGSGCIAINVKVNRPDISVTASDISKSALSVARDNARRLDAKISFLQSDLTAKIFGKFDVITANLPYVCPKWHGLSKELKYEPKTALFAPDKGTGIYQKFISQATKILEPNGLLLIEIDPRQKTDLKHLANKNNFRFEPLSEYCYQLKS